MRFAMGQLLQVLSGLPVESPRVQYLVHFSFLYICAVLRSICVQWAELYSFVNDFPPGQLREL